MSDSDEPSTSGGRRHGRGPPTGPPSRRQRSPSPPRRPVRRRILDTSGDIREAVDDVYVSSDEDDISADGDFTITRDESDFSDSDDSDIDDPPYRQPTRSPPPSPGSSSSSPPSPPRQPLAASTPRVILGNRPVPPDVSAHDPRNYVWTDVTDNFVPHNYAFDETDSGVDESISDLPQDASFLDYFTLLFDAALMDIIVSETNSFFQFSGGVAVATRYSPVQRWKDVDIADMYVFLALTLLMPMAKKHAIRDYWKKDAAIYMPVFGKFMSRDRYQLILRFLHFCDNNNIDRNDPMFKIRLVFDNLTEKFRKLYKPHQKLVIDESLVLFRGRVGFRQYIRTKRHRFGLKIFVLCDCRRGCVLDMILYTGQGTDIQKNDPLGVSGAVVREMMGSYVGKGHIMYLDNWYTSPMLCQYLHENVTGTCGTVKETRKHMPKLPDKQKKGDCVRKNCKNSLAIKWKDKRSVTLLSTLHKGEMVDSGKTTRGGNVIMKPDAVLDYNFNMRLVDKSDMMIGDVECIRKTVKWYKKLFFHLVDVCTLNSYLYYKAKTQKTVPLRTFVETLALQLLEKYGTVARYFPGRAATVASQPDRLLGRDYVARHHLTYIPLVSQAQRKTRSHGQKQCTVCSKTTRRARKTKKTCFMCRECEAPLCVECFVEYHTLTNF